jgi:hypothetical protein
MKGLFFTFLLLSALSAVESSLAQNICLQAPSAAAADVVLQELRVRRTVANCYDIQSHTPDAWKSVSQLLDTATLAKTSAEKSKALADLLTKLQEVVMTEVIDPTRRDQLTGKLSEVLSAIIENARRELTGNVLSTTGWRVTEVTRNGTQVVKSEAFPDTDFNAPIRDGCSGALPTTTCEAAIEDFESTMRTHTAVEGTLGVLHEQDLTQFRELFETRHKMWEAYRTHARPQYPWEWVLNGVLYEDDRPKDVAGNPRGPASLPKGQLILLHPGVGLERFDHKNIDQTQNNPTLFIEWLGYNGLQWDYGTGKLSGGLGISLISTYAQRDDASDWSNGVMFWLQNKYGLAVTRNDSGSSIMLSVDLSELFRDKLNEIGERLRPSPDRK